MHGSPFPLLQETLTWHLPAQLYFAEADFISSYAGAAGARHRSTSPPSSCMAARSVTFTNNQITAERGGFQIGFFLNGYPT